MEQENIYDKIQEIIGNLNGNYNILEEQIDIDLQMEYFELSKEAKNNSERERAMDLKDRLFSPETAIVEKKNLLVQLASLDNVEAFRLLEKYRQNPEPELKDWATLAMQESRMLLESSFLNENQVFISTGLGGKGSKLRYFVVFLPKDGMALAEFQKKIIKTEIEYLFKQSNCDLEEIKISDNFATLKSLIPINSNLQGIFEKIIENCNQFGNFLKANCIVTNVKVLTDEEIFAVLHDNNGENLEDQI